MGGLEGGKEFGDALVGDQSTDEEEDDVALVEAPFPSEPIPLGDRERGEPDQVDTVDRSLSDHRDRTAVQMAVDPCPQSDAVAGEVGRHPVGPPFAHGQHRPPQPGRFHQRHTDDAVHPDRHPRQRSGGHRDESGLRGVGLHDVRPGSPEMPIQPDERQQIGHRADRSGQSHTETGHALGERGPGQPWPRGGDQADVELIREPAGLAGQKGLQAVRDGGDDLQTDLSRGAVSTPGTALRMRSSRRVEQQCSPSRHCHPFNAGSRRRNAEIDR